MTPERIARVCHEANRGLCNAQGDFSQPSWEDAPAWQKDSAIAGVRFALANPKAVPEDQHLSWLAQKIKEGWTYGPEKDPAKKTHPCMLPYESLPAEQRAKDALFLAVVRALEITL